jgi:hypothetical protein
MASISLFTSRGERKENSSCLYMLQNVHRFQGQLRVTRIKREQLPPSLGGLYTPVSKLYFLAGSADILYSLSFQNN